MAFNITPFKSTDEFTMAGFNGKIADINSGIGVYASEYWWRRRVPKTTGYVEKLTDITALVHAGVNTIYKTMNIDQSTGAISFADAITTPGGSQAQYNTILTNAPVYVVNQWSSTITNLYVPTGATGSKGTGTTLTYEDDESFSFVFSGSGSPRTQTVTTQYVSNQPGDWQYLHSPNRSAYPDSGTSGGYEYEYLGIPFDNAVTAPKIETGSYVGTGTFGYQNQNSLTFGFTPKLVIITGGSYRGVAVIPYDGQDAPVHFTTSSSTWKITRSENVISWYDRSNQSANGSTGSSSANTQMNESGKTYYYTAIG